MDNLKFFAKNSKEMDSLELKVQVYSGDIHVGTHFGVEKC